MKQTKKSQHNDFRKLLKTYLSMTGTSISQMATGANVNQRSVSYFLNDDQVNSELGSSKLANCLDFFSIDINHYWRVVELAKKVAVNLKKQGTGMTSVGSLNKAMLAEFSGCKEVNLFLDFKKEDLERFLGKKVDNTQLLNEITKVGIIDVTSTYVYFKQLVNFFLNTSINDFDSKLSSSEGAKVKDILANTIKESSKKLPNEFDFAFKTPTKFGAAPLFSSIPVIGSIILGGASIALGLLLDDDD